MIFNDLVTYRREYSSLEGGNFYGKKFVVWTHPDIPMYGAELILDEEGYFQEVGKTVSEEYVKSFAEGE